MSKFIHIRSRGFALISALVLLVSLTLIAVTTAYRNTLDEMMAANQRDYVNAVGVAESGIEAGFAKVKHNVGGTWVNTGSQEWGADLITLVGAQNRTLLSGSVSYGSYNVGVSAHSMVSGVPTAVLMTSTGSVNGAERVVEVVMEMKPTGAPQYAILMSKDLDKLSGNPIIRGANADVHTNGDIWISGDPIIAGSVTASGQVREGAGEPGVVEGVRGGAALVPIPHIDPNDYRAYRHVLFTSDCRVLDPGGALIKNMTTGSNYWQGWNCDSSKWTMGSSTWGDMYHGIIYVEGNVVISGSPVGATGWAWYVSILATGYIEVSGNPPLRPWGSKAGNDTGNAIADELLFFAGDDLKINGNPGQKFFGIMATHMDLDVSGNPVLEGTLIAENAVGRERVHQELKSIVDKNSISGNMDLTSVSSPIFGAGKKLTVTAWRELVN